MKNKIVYLGLVVIAFYLALLFDMEATRFSLFFLLLLPVVLKVWLFLAGRKIKVQLCPGREIVTRGENMVLSVVIRNEGPFMVSRVGCRLGVETPEGTGRKKEWVEHAVDGHSTTEIIADQTARHCGLFRWKMTGVRIYDPLGLCRRRRRKEEIWEVQVLPRIYSLPLDPEGLERLRAASAVKYDAHGPGDDVSEVHQIREYRPGDRLSGIHWKLTAKEENLMVKEYGGLLGSVLLLFLDFSLPGKEDEENRDEFLEVAASLCFSLVEAECIFQVMWYEDERGFQRKTVAEEEDLGELLTALIGVRSWGDGTDPEGIFSLQAAREFPEAVYCLDRGLRLKKEGRVCEDFSLSTWEEREIRQVRL